PRAEEGGECLFVVSARSPAALRELVCRYVSLLNGSDIALGDICYSAAVTRVHHQTRLALIVRDRTQLAGELQSWLADGRVVGRSGVKNVKLEAVQCRYLEGGNIDWDEIYGPSGTEHRQVKVVVPTYPFQRQRFWRPRPQVADISAKMVADWSMLVATVRRQSETGPLGWDPSDYPTLWRRLDELTIGHAINTLVALGEFANDGARATVDEIV